MRGVVLTAVAAILLAIAGSSPAAADAAAAPANTARPVLSGTSMDGRTVTTSNGSWTGTPPLSFSYRWVRCDSTGASWVTLTGASGQSYSPTASDVGSRIASIVTAANTVGSAPARSYLSATVAGNGSTTSAAWPGNPQSARKHLEPGHTIGSSAAMDPNNASIMSFFPAHLSSNRTFNTTSWTVATAVVKGGEPTYSGPWNCEWSCDLDRFGPVPIPLGTKPDPDHLAILDLVRGRERDLYHASFDGTTWHAGCGNAILLSERAAPAGTCGANDANLPAAAGIVQPEEIAAGVIRHPLVFSVPARGTAAPRCPATAEAKIDPASPVVNGMWFQLDPSLDVGSLPISAWEKVIAKAMQDHGIFVRGGNTIDVYGENTINRDPTAWTRLGLAGGPQFSAAFPWNRLRVLAPPC